MKAYHRKFKGFKIGPGGLGCPCCAPSKKMRKFLYRRGKKQAHRFTLWLEAQDAE